MRDRVRSALMIGYECMPLLVTSVVLNVAMMTALIYRRYMGGRPYRAAACRKCGYDTRATIGGKCPECGEPVRSGQERVHAITHCSFCGRSNRETGPHAEGPDGAYICAPCVEVCHNVILANRTTS